MEKVKARLYGTWGAHNYYRTESGHTFAIDKVLDRKIVFYHGNVKQGDRFKMRMLKEPEKAELFSRVEFID